MQSIRIDEKNKTKLQIREITNCVEKDETVLRQLVQKEGESEYINKQIEKIKEKNLKRKNDLNLLKEKIINIDSGKLDKEINNNIKEISVVYNSKNLLSKRKKKEAKEKKEELSKISKNYYISGRNSDRKHRKTIRDAKRSYKYFERSNNSIPEYMLTNLSNMPNNKGYFWKHIACYGSLPAEKNKPTVLFDRKPRGLLIIHEWTDYEYKIYHKQGKQRKKLYSSQKRIKKNFSENLLNKLAKDK